MKAFCGKLEVAWTTGEPLTHAFKIIATITEISCRQM